MMLGEKLNDRLFFALGLHHLSDSRSNGEKDFGLARQSVPELLLFTSSTDARRLLALSPNLTSNLAQQVGAVTVPAGTIMLIRQAAPQHPANQYPGTGTQIVVGPQTPSLRYGTPRRLP
jgi:hypothetical protein